MSNEIIPQLKVNDRLVNIAGFDPNQSLLSFLRDSLRMTGTKEGCASGDCGACTVVQIDTDKQQAATLNSCITPLGAVLGQQVITVEGLGGPATPHPVQAAMVSEHGSQCGFCTPGFVMSMVGQQLKSATSAALEQLTRADVVRSISGNLCRCTGYRPILAAAQVSNMAVGTKHPQNTWASVPALTTGETAISNDMPFQYQRPANETELQALMTTERDVSLIAGSTDLWLDVSQRYRDFEGFIDLTRVAELREIREENNRLIIGAAVTHAELETLFSKPSYACPAILSILHRFGSPQIRSRGTIGGNIANASPIADWPPILLIADAKLHLAKTDGTRRVVPLSDFYLSYKRTVLAKNEYIAAIELDTALDFQQLQAYKISKREDDDISSVMGAFFLTINDGRIDECRIAFGGVAAIPVRLANVENVLRGQTLDEATIALGTQQLAAAIQPISDVRASAEYRRQVSANLLRKALARANGNGQQTLADFLA